MPEDNKQFGVYEHSKLRMSNLVQAWDSEIEETDCRRAMREIEVDVEAQRKLGKLEQDELYTPLRIIDTNIRQEQASYISYIKQPRRTAIFKSLEDQTLSTTLLESDFTDRSRYDGWELPYFSLIDGFQTHGWDSLEVQYDVGKPGRFALKHISHENLLFPWDAEKIEDLEFIMIREKFTEFGLKKLVDEDEFSSVQMDKVTAAKPSSENTVDVLYAIYKVYFKYKGIVMVAWGEPTKCDGWLRKPRPLFLGIREPVLDLMGSTVGWKNVRVKEYPVVIFPYLITENKKLTSSKGRVWLDEYVQQAVTSLMSSFITAHRRATNPYVSGEDPASDGAVEQTDIKTIPGFIVKGKVNFAFMKAPEASMLSAIQGLVTQNKAETSQVNFAAQNRKDSRKTAEEIRAAIKDSGLLSGVQVALFSIAQRKVVTLCWRINQSCVIQGLIKPSCNPELYKGEYNIQPAGDQDVIERAELVSKMMQTWPVVQAMGPELAKAFFKDLLIYMFPGNANKYIQFLDQDTAMQKQIEGMLAIIKALMIDPTTGGLVPQAQPYQQQIEALINGPEQQG